MFFFKVATAVLSITNKQKRKDAEKKKDSSDKMDVDEEKKDAAATEVKKEEEPKKEEPLFEVLSNPARVMRPQLAVVSLEQPAKYKPIKDISIGGQFKSNFKKSAEFIYVT